jgi:hypothetical protein
MGRDAGVAAEEVAHYGMEAVYAVDVPILDAYHPELYLSAIVQACGILKPKAVLLGDTLTSVDLAPRIAFSLGGGLVTDCAAIECVGGEILLIKPVYGGKVMAAYTPAAEPFVAILRSGSAIRKMGGYDLILAGRQAADWNAGQVGVGVAHLLGVPVVTLARKVEVRGGCAIVERLTSAGYETVRAPLPAAVVVSNEVGMMRYPTIVQRREAKKKPVVSWGAGDIDLGRPLENRLHLRKLFAPATRQRDCVFVGGESAAEAGRKLAERLSSDGII